MKHNFVLDESFDTTKLNDLEYSDLCEIYIDQLKLIKNLSLEVDQRSIRISALELQMRKIQNELNALKSDDSYYRNNLNKMRNNADKIFDLIDAKKSD